MKIGDVHWSNQLSSTLFGTVGRPRRTFVLVQRDRSKIYSWTSKHWNKVVVSLRRKHKLTNNKMPICTNIKGSK